MDPVPFAHFLSGAVPRKCAGCASLFEGQCLRAMDTAQRYLRVDHGKCPKPGATHPVPAPPAALAEADCTVPAKCAACEFLAWGDARRLHCRLDADVWAAFPRDLDWGDWAPALPNLGLESGKHVSTDLLRAVVQRQELAAIRAYRASHPTATVREARDAYAALRRLADPSSS